MRKEDWAKAAHSPPSVEELLEMLTPLAKKEPEAKVCILGDLILDGDLRSYRGYYDQLALGYCMERWNGDYPGVDRLIETLKAAVGQEFEGYKGGLFMMYSHTPVWLANYGSYPGAVITGAQLTYDRIYLRVVMDPDL